MERGQGTRRKIIGVRIPSGEMMPVAFPRAAQFPSSRILCGILFGFLILGCSHREPAKMEARSIQAGTSFHAPPVAPATLGSARAALERIRDQYRSEFHKMSFPMPGKTPSLCASATGCRGFPRTMEAIGELERKDVLKNVERAHLTILKGMIDLQSERFRSARGMEAEMVKAASSVQSGADRLMAENFSGLVEGWSELHQHRRNLKAQEAGKPFPFRSVDFRNVQKAADRVRENLQQHVSRDPGILRDRDSDLRGLYVAAVTATFYTWVQNRPGRKKKGEETLFYERGRDLIGLFLTDQEKSLKRASHGTDPASPHRERYLEWYSWLSAKCRNELPPS